MKKFIIVLMVMALTGVAFAETVYTKTDTLTMKITTTTQKEEVQSLTLSELLTQKVRKLNEIKSNRDSYVTKDASLKGELLEIETEIAEAGKLGIIETPEVIKEVIK